MPEYAVFLRAVNVGGRSALKMGEVRAALEDIGHTGVATVIASGNIVLTAPGTEKVVKAEVERCLADRFGLQTTAFVRSRAQLRRLLADHPEDTSARGTLYVCFLDAKPPVEVAKAVAGLSRDDEVIEVHGREMFTWTTVGRSQSSIKPSEFKRTGLAPVTERKITTLRKIAAKFSN
jgi:uncharacterized protein (DUF1697 family)